MERLAFRACRSPLAAARTPLAEHGHEHEHGHALAGPPVRPELPDALELRHVGAVLGPGVLLVPALAAQAAGPASVLAWVALLTASLAIAENVADLLGSP